MPTPDDVEAFRMASKNVVAIAKRELIAFWSALDLSDPAQARDLLLTFMSDLNDRYGNVASAVAADWYEELRDAAPAKGQYRATATGAVPDAQVQASVRYGASSLWTPDAAPTLRHLLGVTDRFVKQAARNTVARSVRGDKGVTYSRVPSGTDTCAFCLVLASRGPVYESRESAKYRADGDKYHNDCDCVPTPSWGGDDLPEGYDPEGLYQSYLTAKGKADSGSTKDILASIRQLSGSH
ncbi:UNVERIFIED_ORG: hypothetical protein M2328_006126 [Rhodococcus erythropolis]